MQAHHHIDGRMPVSANVIAALDVFIDQVEDAPAGVVPVITGTGEPGAADADAPDVALVNKWERVLRRLERLNRPTVAVVHGDCGGIAVEALLATDLRVAAPRTRLHLPAGPGGVWPGMGLYRLANQVGFARVRRWILFGYPLSAAEAVGVHLVDEVAEDTGAAIAAVVARLETADGADVAVRRQLMLDATTTTFEEALGRHLAACDRLSRRTREVANVAG
ncbi:enoyl-CoA-hydratase DpgB [Actinophytocola algeriensis]|uniref:Isomerase DpgB n=1 Tax=Actinophytocola algeriensis TaxID=1768010 RepID=A0A7W7Q3K6_9PSEU|nr:enoyl-CoA-hydratase DpgB [Actinophytocola algeriensis]MBB4906248.1 isomerase DpgB [Actinophytocola algeriensis]MBE1472067.1 isomerase DpgB [Actinophytocola algeriensis]